MAKTVAALLDAPRVAQFCAFNPPYPHGATQPRFLGPTYRFYNFALLFTITRLLAFHFLANYSALHSTSDMHYREANLAE